MMDEKDELSSRIKQIGIGIIGFAAILFTFLTFIVGLADPNPSILFCLLIFTSLLVCIGFFFLFLGSSHDEIGTYLIFMGLGLIVISLLTSNHHDFFHGSSNLHGAFFRQTRITQ